MIQDYITKSCLDKVSDMEGAAMLKGGQIRIDPLLYAILNPKPAGQTETVRKDAIFKSITSCTNAAYVISTVDPNEAKSAQEAESFTLQHKASNTYHHGQVPKVKVEALKYRNKKQTRMSGLELYQVDLQEFARYLRNKCQASVTIGELVQSQKQSGSQPVKGPLREIIIQGQMIKDIEDALTRRYMIPQKYIETINKLPDKKKK